MSAKNRPLTKAKLIARMAQEMNVPRKDVGIFFEVLHKMAVQETAANDCFAIPGLGKMVKIQKKERVVRNPATGRPLKVKARTGVKFRPAKAFKEAVCRPQYTLSALKPGTYDHAEFERLQRQESVLMLEGKFERMERLLDTLSQKRSVPIEKIVVIYEKKNAFACEPDNILSFPQDACSAAGRPVQAAAPEPEPKRRKRAARQSVPGGIACHQEVARVIKDSSVDPNLCVALIQQEGWFAANAGQEGGEPAQDDRAMKYALSAFQKTLGYIRYEYTYYRKSGFDKTSASLCALASYREGRSNVRQVIRTGEWDGTTLATMPFEKTRDYVQQIINRWEPDCSEDYGLLAQ